jgi:hypothetical protein
VSITILPGLVVLPNGANISQYQELTLPFRFELLVYSGIAPPPALLAAMQAPQPPPRPPPRPGVPAVPNASASAYHQSVLQHGTSGSAVGQYEDAPPSYEDAIAEDMPPVNGPRVGYIPPPVQEGGSMGIDSDQKM